MKVIPFIYDDIDDLCANTYLLIDDSNCIVIDPSRKYHGLIDYIEKNQLSLKGILLTHGHFDHMRGINDLLNKYDAPLFIGFNDEEALTDGRKNLSLYCGEDEVVVNKRANTVSDGEVLSLLSEPISVIETPFHTVGSVCYYLKDSKIFFSGDTLFKGSIGRDDLPRADVRKKRDSLTKLMKLPEEVKVYPGHGSATTIGYEKKYNPFVN